MYVHFCIFFTLLRSLCYCCCYFVFYFTQTTVLTPMAVALCFCCRCRCRWCFVVVTSSSSSSSSLYYVHSLGRMLSISFAWFLIRFDSTLGILSLLLICLLQIHYSKHLPFFSYLVTSGVNRTARRFLLFAFLVHGLFAPPGYSIRLSQTSFCFAHSQNSKQLPYPHHHTRTHAHSDPLPTALPLIAHTNIDSFSNFPSSKLQKKKESVQPHDSVTILLLKNPRTQT